MIRNGANLGAPHTQAMGDVLFELCAHEACKAEMMKRPGVRVEIERWEGEERPILDEILAAYKTAGLSRFEDVLVTGKHSPQPLSLRSSIYRGV